MDWGMKNRLSRIIKPETGRTVMLAVDHGYFMGPTHKLEEPRKTIEPLLGYSDAIMCTRGVLRTSINPGSNVPIVLRVSGGASVIGESLTNEAITTSVTDAIRLNVAAMAVSIFVGSAHEHQTLTNLGKLVNEGEEHGIPVLAVTAVGKELEKRDARYLALACRVHGSEHLAIRASRANDKGNSRDSSLRRVCEGSPGSLQSVKEYQGTGNP